MQTLSLDVIGTHLDIRLYSDDDYSEIFSRIVERLTDFEKKYSRFLEDNWLGTLNRERSILLDKDAREMLEYALRVARETDGYFDPTVGKRLTELGYGNTKCKVQNVKYKVQTAKGEEELGDYRDIELIGDAVILHGDIELEFGGVGKGYLIDVIESIVRNTKGKIENSEEKFLINFGGDLYGFGGWKVGLESPFASDEIIGMIVLEDDFLACSAGTKRKWGDHHHLINPKTGESAREVVATYIEGKTGMMSDAYATALAVMPWELAIITLEKTPDIEGVLVRYDGVLHQSKGSGCKAFK